MIDFEAGLDVLNGFARPGEQFHVAAVREIIAAALGDEALYRYEALSPSHTTHYAGCPCRTLVQVWPALPTADDVYGILKDSVDD